MATSSETDTRTHENIICVRKLPRNVFAKQISDLFEPFGLIVNLYLKRRVAKDSKILLENPFVVIVFENRNVVDEILASRPFFIGEQQLLVRRFFPKTSRLVEDTNHVTTKALVRVHDENPQDILPDDDLILKYLQKFGGQILYSTRLDDQTFLVQFDDYDPVDLACLSPPHFIGQQFVTIERCLDEQRVRSQIQTRLKSEDFSTNENGDGFNSFSPFPVLSFEDQKGNLMAEHSETITEIERKHDENIRQLKDELRSVTEERIRFQRLTLDLERERDLLLEDNRKWQKLYSESIVEKPLLQEESETMLNEIREKISLLKKNKS